MFVTGFSIIIGIFLLYYFLLLFLEKRLMSEPTEIISKFLSAIMLYVGISIMYYAVTGNPLFDDTIESYRLYIFIIGFVSVFWTIPSLLSDFRFFRRFTSAKETKGTRK